MAEAHCTFGYPKQTWHECGSYQQQLVVGTMHAIWLRPCASLSLFTFQEWCMCLETTDILAGFPIALCRYHATLPPPSQLLLYRFWERYSLVI